MKKRILFILILFLLSGCTVRVEPPQEMTVPGLSNPQTEIPIYEVQTEPTVPNIVTVPTEPTEPPTQPLIYGPDTPLRLPINVYGKPGEFMSLEEESGEPVPDPQGLLYGFRDDYWSGCSVWCAVTSHEEGVGASSFLEPIGEYVYEPGNLTDGNLNTVWSEGVPGYGIGEHIVMTRRFNWDAPQTHKIFEYRTICIVNGYAQNETKWQNNSRVKTMSVHVNDILLLRLHLVDTIKPQYFDISQLGLTTLAGEEIKFRFTIEDVYPGEKFEDTCVTGIEIEFWTENH